MSITEYVVLATLLIGWYVLSQDKSSKKEKVEVQEVKTLDEILSETEGMYEHSTERICEMFEKSREEIRNIHKAYIKELQSNRKITIKEK